MLEKSGGQIWAVEIKRTAAPKIKSGFHTACQDIRATKKFIVYPGIERFPMSNNTEALGIVEFLKILATAR